jgi:hypothetical protein
LAAYKYLGKLIVRDICQFLAMELGNDKLYQSVLCSFTYREMTYGMAFAERLDVEKGENLITLKELEGRNVSYRLVLKIVTDAVVG